MGREVEYDIVLYEDNEGAKALAENPLSSGRSKPIDVRWHFIWDLVRSGVVRIEHVDSEWQCADILTKPPGVFRQSSLESLSRDCREENEAEI